MHFGWDCCKRCDYAKEFAEGKLVFILRRTGKFTILWLDLKISFSHKTPYFVKIKNNEKNFLYPNPIFTSVKKFSVKFPHVDKLKVV